MTGENGHQGPHPVDVVIAWVDGDDPELARKRRQYLDEKDHENLPSGAHATRFASINEIKYCVLSIMRFAPFVRNIFIVTDGQDPGLDKDILTYFPGRAGSVRIVDHKEIFRGFEKYLPTFNSISIGNMVWRIKGLSENFVYFNDDTFLIRPVKKEDWFIDNKPVLRGKWVPFPLPRILWTHLKVRFKRLLQGNKDYQPRASFHMGQWNSAFLAGYRLRYFTNSHTPHTVERQTVAAFFSRNQELLEKNISYRFRNYKQFTFIALSNHLQLRSGNRQIAHPSLAYLQPFRRAHDYTDKKIRYCENNPGIKYLCVQSLDLCEKEKQDRVLNWLQKILEQQDGHDVT